jgi:peroxiredoxin (alkyl hydroperoxide reductase subunit C)
MSVLVGKKAPSFKAKAVQGTQIIPDFSLDQFHGKQYVVLFFYPKDFTFVCPTELHAFQEQIEAFKQRNTAVVGCSTDSEFSHYAWLQMPKSEGGIHGVSYPIIADTNKTIASAFDVLNGYYTTDEEGNLEATSELVAYRGLFLIDRNGIVQHQVVNNMPLGRNVNEVLRMIDALQHFENHGEVCPMNWSKGDKAMKANNDGLKTYFASASKN